jgi:hypothetical protein
VRKTIFVERSKLPAVHVTYKELLGPTPAQGTIINRVLECRGMNSESAKDSKQRR